jgi:MFS transporter, FHS family, L-fucose permease
MSANKGKKFVLLLFLAIALFGMLIPVISISKYYFVLIAIFLIGLGMTGLQVAGNPVMCDVSAPGLYSRNLTFAQFIKSLGSITAPYVIPLIVVVFGFGWQNIFVLYAAVIAICLVLVMQIRINEPVTREDVPATSIKSSFQLLRHPFVLLMVLGIFLYVGAEVGLNSWIAIYLNRVFGLDIESLATLGIGFFLTTLVIGRMMGAIVLNFLPAKKFFVISSLLGLIGLIGMFIPSQTVVIISILICGLGFGNIFPLIFSILIDSMPEKSNELSGLMVMAIVGGAIVPGIMGVIADWSIRIAFLLPVIIFVYLGFLSVYTWKHIKEQPS